MKSKNLKFLSFLALTVMLFVSPNVAYATSGGIEIPNPEEEVIEKFTCSICENEYTLSENTKKDIEDYNSKIYDFICDTCYTNYYNKYVDSIIKDIPTKWENDWETIRLYNEEELAEFYNNFNDAKDHIIFDTLIKQEHLNILNSISSAEEEIIVLKTTNSEDNQAIEDFKSAILEQEAIIEEAEEIIELYKDALEDTPEYDLKIEAEEAIVAANKQITNLQSQISNKENKITLNNEKIDLLYQNIESLSPIAENVNLLSSKTYNYVSGDLQKDFFNLTFNLEWLNDLGNFDFFNYLSSYIKNEEDEAQFKLYLTDLEEYQSLSTDNKTLIDNLIKEAYADRETYEEYINVEVPEEWKDKWNDTLFLKSNINTEKTTGIYKFINDRLSPTELPEPSLEDSVAVDNYNKAVIEITETIDALIKKMRDELTASGADMEKYALDKDDISEYSSYLHTQKINYEKDSLYVAPEAETTSGTTVKPNPNEKDKAVIPTSTYKASDFTLSQKTFTYIRGWLDPGHAVRSSWAKCVHSNFSSAEKCYLDQNYPWYKVPVYEDRTVMKERIIELEKPPGSGNWFIQVQKYPVTERVLVGYKDVRDKYSASPNEVASAGHVWNDASNGLHLGVNAREIFDTKNTHDLFTGGPDTNTAKLRLANGRNITFGSKGTLADDNNYQGNFRVISRSGSWYYCYYTKRSTSEIQTHKTCYLLPGEPMFKGCSYSEDSFAPNGIKTEVIQGNNYLHGKTSASNYTTEDSNLVIYVEAQDQKENSNRLHSGINHFEAHVYQYAKDKTEEISKTIFTTPQAAWNSTKVNYGKDGNVSAVFSLKPTGICKVVIYAVDAAGNYSGELFNSGKMYIDRAAPEAITDGSVVYNTRIIKDRETYGLAEAIELKINFRDKLEENTIINNGKNEVVSAGNKYSGYKNIYALVTNVDILAENLTPSERADILKALFRENSAVGNISDISKSEKIVYTVKDENVKISSVAEAKTYEIIPYVKSDGTTTKPYSVSNRKTENVSNNGNVANDDTTIGNTIYMSNFVLEETGNYYIYWCAVDYAGNWVCNKEGLYVVAGVKDSDENEIEIIPNPTDGSKNFTVEKGSSGTLKVVIRGLTEDQVKGNPLKGIGRAYVAINFPKWTADYEYLENNNKYTYTSGYYISDTDFEDMTYGTYDPSAGQWVEGVVKYEIDTYDPVTGKSLILRRDEALDNYQDGIYVYYHNFVVPMGVEAGSTYDIDIKLVTPTYGVDPVVATQVYSTSFTVTETENMSTYEVNTGND